MYGEGWSKIENLPAPDIKPTSDKRNVLAIIAFVLAFLIPPIALILGIIAIIQITKTKDNGIVLAISSLGISVVMSVVYVVAIGAAMMVVMQGLGEERLEQAAGELNLITCMSDVRMEVHKKCLSEGKVAFMLENSGMVEVVGWQITVLGDDIYTSELQDSLPKGSINELEFSFDDVGEIIAIQLRPQILGGLDKRISCTDPNLEWEKDHIELWEDCDTVTWDD